LYSLLFIDKRKNYLIILMITKMIVKLCRMKNAR
jgi:hypothetical protein